MNPRLFITNCIQGIAYSILLSFFMAGLILTILISANPPHLDHPICREVCLQPCHANAVCEFNCYHDCIKEVDAILSYKP